jgi:hypothetical protein
MVWGLIAAAGRKAAGGMYKKGYGGGRGSKAAKFGSFLLDPGGFLDPGAPAQVEWKPGEMATRDPSQIGADPAAARHMAMTQGALAQQGQWDPTTRNQFIRAGIDQQDLLQGLAGTAATGQGVALDRTTQMYDQMRQQQQAAMRSSPTMSAGMKARVGESASAELQAQQALQTNLIRAQAQAQARQQLGQMAGAMRGQEQQAALGAATMQQQLGQFNAQQMQQLQQAMMSDEQARQTLRARAQQQLGMSYDQMRLAKAQAEAGYYQQSSQRAQGAGQQALSGLLGGLIGRR